MSIKVRGDALSSRPMSFAVASGAVAICVGIDFGGISSMTRLSDYAARSID